MSVRTGAMRLVLVLGEAPAEMVRTVDFLQSVTDAVLQIDLVTVTAYQMQGSRILVPQRIEPGVSGDREVENRASTAQQSSSSPAPDGFIVAIRGLGDGDDVLGEAWRDHVVGSPAAGGCGSCHPLEPERQPGDQSVA